MSPRQREDQARDLFRPVGAVEAVLVRLARHARIFAWAGAAIAVFYLGNVVVGYRAAPDNNGTIEERSLNASVLIRRDVRDIAHITASTENDAFFAQGFVEASDRLFQMEMTRRYALGTLAEVLGPHALGLDKAQRYYDVRDIAERQWEELGPRERAELTSFTAGVNAAMQRQPLPIEFRLLLYGPEPWRPQDSLAVSLAVSIALADSWRDVLSRDAIWQRLGAGAFDEYLPLSDPRYDVSLNGHFTPHAEPAQRDAALGVLPHSHTLPRAGSNAWATGASRTRTGRALLANDPHLDLTIPGLWYLVDVRAPGIHVAGASIPGVPGVLLGHNERIAWGATNADTVAMTLYQPGRLERRDWARETFHVRFSGDVEKAYYRTDREFGVPDEDAAQKIVLVRWRPYDRLRAVPDALGTFLALDRAPDVRGALRVLAPYEGTAENFVIGDTHGEVAYQLAGAVPDDTAWGRYVRRAPDLREGLRAVPFARLPSIAPSRDAMVVSANNRMYANGYPYRLAAGFDPPYRAYRIAQLLHARTGYDVAYFAKMQLDTVSPADLEFARSLGAYARGMHEPDMLTLATDLRRWDGAFAPGSETASAVHALRSSLEQGQPSFYAMLRQLRAGTLSPTLDADVRGALYTGSTPWQPWGAAGLVHVEHPIASLPFGFLDGPTLPGDGDEYTIHLQEDGFSQSFRAVWDVGNWDAGGIVIPSGESGETGSGHYTDLAPAWIAGRLEALPFSERAVEAATLDRLLLKPPGAH
ncbi:MAG: penicillin acylase family protein [Candidatus Eremiobacteraeota bacterium]|nr:penicillin acylase family protein [Candidatus Eremiobacteraeota bacterium]